MESLTGPTLEISLHFPSAEPARVTAPASLLQGLGDGRPSQESQPNPLEAGPATNGAGGGITAAGMFSF